VEERVTQLEPERFRFTSADGLSIACVKWSPRSAPRHVHDPSRANQRGPAGLSQNL